MVVYKHITKFFAQEEGIRCSHHSVAILNSVASFSAWPKTTELRRPGIKKKP